MNAGEFLVLKEHADHFGKAEVGAESQFADAIAVFVGVAIIPELTLEILARAFESHQTRAFDGQLHRRRLQITVLAVEIIAGGGVADESAVERRRSCEYLSGGKIRPITRADESAGLHPVEAAVEMRRERSACPAFHCECLRPQH